MASPAASGVRTAAAVVRERLSSLLHPGRIEVVLSVSLAALAVVLELPLHRPWQGLAIDLAAFVFSALSARWPTFGGLLVAAWLAIRGTLPAEYGALGDYAPLIVILGVGMRGEIVLRRALAVVYLVFYLPVTYQAAGGQQVYLLGWWIWVFLVSVAWVIGNAFHTVQEANRQARAAELVLQRQVLARELHDTVARSFTTVSMISERARLRGEVNPDDLDAISQAAEKGVDELRWMLSLLRDPSASVEALGGNTSLAEALSAAESGLIEAGFPTSITVDGNLDDLSEQQSATLAAVTAEAAANVIRHGDHNQSAGVVVEVDADTVEIAFINTVSADDERRSADPLGLWGMRQRVEQLGGDVTAGTEDQHWVTRVRLPLSESTPQE